VRPLASTHPYFATVIELSKKSVNKSSTSAARRRDLSDGALGSQSTPALVACLDVPDVERLQVSGPKRVEREASRRRRRPRSAGASTGKTEGYWHSMERAPIAPLVDAAQSGWKQVLQASPKRAQVSSGMVWERIQALWNELRVPESHRTTFRLQYAENPTAQSRHVSQLIRHRQATIRVLGFIREREAIEHARCLLEVTRQPGLDEEALAADVAKTLALAQHWSVQFAEALNQWWAEFTCPRPFMVRLQDGSGSANYSIRIGSDLDEYQESFTLSWAERVFGDSPKTSLPLGLFNGCSAQSSNPSGRGAGGGNGSLALWAFLRTDAKSVYGTEQTFVDSIVQAMGILEVARCTPRATSEGLLFSNSNYGAPAQTPAARAAKRTGPFRHRQALADAQVSGRSAVQLILASGRSVLGSHVPVAAVPSTGAPAKKGYTRPLGSANRASIRETAAQDRLSPSWAPETAVGEEQNAPPQMEQATPGSRSESRGQGTQCSKRTKKGKVPRPRSAGATRPRTRDPRVLRRSTRPKSTTRDRSPSAPFFRWSPAPASASPAVSRTIHCSTFAPQDHPDQDPSSQGNPKVATEEAQAEEPPGEAMERAEDANEVHVEPQESKQQQEDDSIRVEEPEDAPSALRVTDLAVEARKDFLWPADNVFISLGVGARGGMLRTPIMGVESSTRRISWPNCFALRLGEDPDRTLLDGLEVQIGTVRGTKEEVLARGKTRQTARLAGDLGEELGMLQVRIDMPKSVLVACLCIRIIRGNHAIEEHEAAFSATQLGTQCTSVQQLLCAVQLQRAFRRRFAEKQRKQRQIAVDAARDVLVCILDRVADQVRERSAQVEPQADRPSHHTEPPANASTSQPHLCEEPPPVEPTADERAEAAHESSTTEVVDTVGDVSLCLPVLAKVQDLAARASTAKNVPCSVPPPLDSLAGHGAGSSCQGEDGAEKPCLSDAPAASGGTIQNSAGSGPELLLPFPRGSPHSSDSPANSPARSSCDKAAFPNPSEDHSEDGWSQSTESREPGASPVASPCKSGPPSHSSGVSEPDCGAGNAEEIEQAIQGSLAGSTESPQAARGQESEKQALEPVLQPEPSMAEPVPTPRPQTAQPTSGVDGVAALEMETSQSSQESTLGASLGDSPSLPQACKDGATRVSPAIESQDLSQSGRPCPEETERKAALRGTNSAASAPAVEEYDDESFGDGASLIADSALSSSSSSASLSILSPRETQGPVDAGATTTSETPVSDQASLQGMRHVLEVKKQSGGPKQGTAPVSTAGAGIEAELPHPGDSRSATLKPEAPEADEKLKLRGEQHVPQQSPNPVAGGNVAPNSHGEAESEDDGYGSDEFLEEDFEEDFDEYLSVSASEVEED